MKRQSYQFTETENAADRCITDVPLAINSAGLEHVSAPFRSKRIRHDYYLLLLIRGEMTITLSDRRHEMRAGNCLLLPPETVFVHELTHGVANYYWLHFSGSRAQELISELGFAVNRTLTLPICDEIAGCFTRIFQEFILRDRRAPLALGALLTEALTAIVRRTEGGADFPLASVEYMHRHYSDPVTLRQLAALENFSVSHYRTVFKKYVGMSPNEYLIMQRMNAACFYLKQTEMSVHEVANAVGYADPFYFSRIFKKKMGCSPAKYAK